MKRLGIIAIVALSGIAFSGVASADKSYISFMQVAAAGPSTQGITSVQGGTAYEIVGNVNVSLTWVGLCVAVGTNGGYHCQQILTDSNGEFAVSSAIDSCNFEISPLDFVSCDPSAGTLNFSVWKWGKGSHILANGSLVVN